MFPFPLYRIPTALSGKPVQLRMRYCCFVHLSGKLNYRFMSMVQRVFAKFISVIKFYHWRQNVHMPFNFHNIFAHHTHTQLHCTYLPPSPSPPLGATKSTVEPLICLGKYYDGRQLVGGFIRESGKGVDYWGRGRKGQGYRASSCGANIGVTS